MPPEQDKLAAVIHQSQKHALLRRIDTLFNPSTDELVAVILEAAELGFSPTDILNAVRAGEALDVLHAAAEPPVMDNDYWQKVTQEIDERWERRYSYDNQREDWS